MCADMTTKIAVKTSTRHGEESHNTADNLWWQFLSWLEVKPEVKEHKQQQEEQEENTQFLACSLVAFSPPFLAKTRSTWESKQSTIAFLISALPSFPTIRTPLRGPISVEGRQSNRKKREEDNHKFRCSPQFVRSRLGKPRYNGVRRQKHPRSLCRSVRLNFSNTRNYGQTGTYCPQ